MSDLVLGEWVETLLAQGKSPATVNGYLADVMLYGGWQGCFTNDRALAIRGSGRAPRTIARHLASHASLARFCNETTSVFAHRPRVGVVLPDVVPTQQEMVAFVEAETDPTYRAMWSLMCGAGLRLAEALSLTGGSFNGERVRVVGKGSKLRDVPLSPEVVADIAPVLRGTSVHGKLFEMSPRTVQRRVKANARQAGLPDTWHPHALRHGFGTAVQEAGGDIRLTGDLLGHSSVSTTMIYTHVRDSRRAAVVQSVLAR